MGRSLYPIFLDLADRLVVVVGGGAVATARVINLAAHDARVRLVSPDTSPTLAEMVGDGRVAEHRARAYAPGDLDGAVLVIAATNDADVNRRVRDDARAVGAEVNVADDPDGSTAIIPALMRQGDLAVAITTGGASPVVARRLRQELEISFGPGWAGLIGLLRECRDDLKRAHPSVASRRGAVEALLDSGVVDRIAERGPGACRDEVLVALGITTAAGVV